MKSPLCALALLVWFHIPILAQSISITGTVVDSSSSQAIAGAAVKLIGYPSIVSATGSDGSFALTGTTTGVLAQNPRASRPYAITLDKSSLTISGANSATPLTVDAFLGNGARIYRVSQSVTTSGSVHFNNLPSVPGLYYVKISGGSISQTLACFATSLETTHYAGVPAGSATPLEKANAAYTIEISKAGYATRQVSASTETANLGTLRLKAISTAAGVWTNVTPAGVTDLNADFGVQDVIADPARPSDLYAFICLQGVWKSTDFGATWSRITASGVMTSGRAWGNAIDPNPNRNPNTPPTLYACQGYGASGFWKSTDGVTWAQKSMGSISPDIYSIDADPTDGAHVITGFHEAAGLAESTDGGTTWRSVSTPGSGTSWYAFFVNTGNATTTKTTWYALPQDGGSGAYRTTNSGSSWSQVGTFVHPHGGSQLFDAGNGVFYVGARGGVWKSTNYCASFVNVSTADAGNIIGTPSYLYASRFQGWPSSTSNEDPGLQRAPRNPGTAWQTMAKPSGMNDGAKRSAVTFDGTHYVIVSGNWRQGIWRYVEP